MFTNSQLERATPFKRKIHPDEIWLYRNPRTNSYVPTEILWPFVFGIPVCTFLLHFLVTKNKLEFIQANLSISLALGLNGIITNVLKLSVGKRRIWHIIVNLSLNGIHKYFDYLGRPRPDFFWRCFPNGEMNIEMECTGDADAVIDGRKSFPSGHSSCKFER